LLLKLYVDTKKKKQQEMYNLVIYEQTSN